MPVLPLVPTLPGAGVPGQVQRGQIFPTFGAQTIINPLTIGSFIQLPGAGGALTLTASNAINGTNLPTVSLGTGQPNEKEPGFLVGFGSALVGTTELFSPNFTNTTELVPNVSALKLNSQANGATTGSTAEIQADTLQVRTNDPGLVLRIRDTTAFGGVSSSSIQATATQPGGSQLTGVLPIALTTLGATQTFVQAGASGVTFTAGSGPLSFPTAFPVATDAIVVSPFGIAAGDQHFVGVISVTASGATLSAATAAGAFAGVLTVSFVAFGH